MQRSVEDLRSELRSLGYLSRGVERWFALDPFRSTTFWRELAIVVAKAVVLLTPLALAPILAIFALRNSPLAVSDLALIGGAWLLTIAVVLAALLTAVALALRTRADLGVEHPRVLSLVAAATAAIPTALLGLWWSGFERPPGPLELLLGASLLVLFFVLASAGTAAALLSFTIFETGRIPTIRQTSPVGLLVLSAAVLVALIAVPQALRSEATDVATPLSVPVTPTSGKLALIAVDGITARDALRLGAGLHRFPLPHTDPGAPPQRWATIATGTPPALHGVHAIDGIRLAGSGRLLQEVSSGDVVLRFALPALGLARREPLPPSVRQRDYVWEITARRGVPSVAVNWWASGSARAGALEILGQEQIFTEAAASAERSRRRPARVDALAIDALLERIAGTRFAALYLPGADILRNRLDLPQGVIDLELPELVAQIRETVDRLRSAGWDVIVVGTSSSSTESVMYSSLRGRPASLDDLAPTILDYFGFPRSAEMGGRGWLSDRQETIPSYGTRGTEPSGDPPDDEYFESLRSLGYIQ